MFHVPYAVDTVRLPNAILKGNETADNPVEFDIAPAWGPDLARLKSVVIALTGTADERDLATGNWTPMMQDAVIKAFDTGHQAFVNTITSIRGLTIGVPMALRSGVLPALPAGMELDAKVPVLSGEQFSRICGHPELAGIALFMAFKITALTGKQDVDARFFVQPSGSGGPGTRRRKTSTAKRAPSKPRRPETAGSQGQTASPDPGTSPSN